MGSISRRQTIAMGLSVALVGCGGDSASSSNSPPPPPPPPLPVKSVTSVAIATFKAPWSLAFLPDGRILVTDNLTHTLSVVNLDGTVSNIPGLPDVGGLYDVVLSPFFSRDSKIYFTFAQPAPPGTPRNGRQAADLTLFNGRLALATAQLVQTGSDLSLSNVTVIWGQTPYIAAEGEFGGRIAFSPDTKYLFLSTGDRQEFDPVQSLNNTLGKIVRLNLDGSVPAGNPFAATAGALPEIWTLGHRNPYGLAFGPDGQLWESENGPKGGDEFNLIKPGLNYGWPVVSYGDNYDGSLIKKPAPGDGFEPSAYWWTPAIAPAGMIFYKGNVFGDWRGDAILTGLVSKALIRVRLKGNGASEVQRIDMGARIRDIQEAVDGSLWVLEDAPTGRLLQISPVF